jgi:DNA-3-methyladenine glycosylase II
MPSKAKFLHDEPAISAGLNYLLRYDPVFKTLKKRDDLWRWQKNAGRFSDLIEMVISQQISVKAADAIFAKLKIALGAPVTPEIFLKLPEKKLREAGLSFQKIDYITGLAEAILTRKINLTRLKAMPDEAVIEAITKLKGFGIWSAHMYLMFSLARPDVFPIGDLGVQNGAQIYTKAEEKMTPKILDQWGEQFKGKRTAAALLLWKLKDSPKT